MSLLLRINFNVSIKRVYFDASILTCLLRQRHCLLGLVDAESLIKGLRTGIIGMAGLDVYENEAGYFFRDCSDTPVQVGRLLVFRTTFSYLVSYISIARVAHCI